MKQKLANFFKTELHYTKVGLEKEDDLIHRGNICWYAIQRGLGASAFAQMCGLSYEEVEAMFNQYKAELEEMEYAVH